MENHRNVEPPVYNRRRLTETPIPSPSHQLDSFSDTDDSDSVDASFAIETSVVDDEHLNCSNSMESLAALNDTDTTNNGDENGNDAVANTNDVDQNTDSTERTYISVNDEVAIDEIAADMANSSSVNQSENDPLAVSAELVVDLSIDDSTTATTDGSILGRCDAAEQPNGNFINAQNTANGSMANIVIKSEPVPLYDTHVCNDNEIDDVLDEPLEEVCDDVVIIIGRSGIPKPLRMTTDQTIKRENDPMSGNLTFSVSVSMHCVHFMNKKTSLISKHSMFSFSNRRVQIVQGECMKSASHW